MEYIKECMKISGVGIQQYLEKILNLSNVRMNLHIKI